MGSSARTEYEYLFSSQIDSCRGKGIAHSVYVGIVARQFAVTVNDGVDRAAFGNAFVEFVEERN